MIKYIIKKQESFTDHAEICDIPAAGGGVYGQGVQGFQVDFDIEVKHGMGVDFHIVFQNIERNDGMKAYGLFDMMPAIQFGCDADESHKLEVLLDYSDNYTWIIEGLTEIAEKECKEWFNLNK